MLNRRDLLTGLPIGLAGLAAAAHLPVSRAFAQARPITIGHPADVPSWDPVANGSTVIQAIHKCMFDQPLSLAPNLSFGPSVVSRFRWLDTEGKVLELTLRDDVTFHNGDKLTSDDIKFSFNDRLKADNTLMLAGVFGTLVAAIETPSPTMAIIKLATPFVTLPQQLSSTASFIMPRGYFEKVGAKAFAENPVGSGPYRLVDYQRDSRIVFEAYDKYWAGRAKIDRVVFQIIKDPSARIAAIQSGQVDLVSALPVRDVVRLGGLPGLVGASDPINNVVLIQMVNKGIFRDQNLRLAMHHAIDKQALSRAFFNGTAAPLSMWAGEGAPANDPKFTFPYDQAKAKALLARSGYDTSKPAKIPFATLNGVFPSDFDMARAIVQMWKQVGIEADLQVMEILNYGELSRNDKLELPVLYSWSNPTGDPNVYSGTILDPKKRFSVWKSDDISPRLDPLLTETDYDKRMAGYREFDKWAVEQGYAFPLLQSTATIVHTNRLKYVPFRNGWTLPYYWSMA
jgi:peptide/nickel transport system substrate-binding protein